MVWVPTVGVSGPLPKAWSDGNSRHFHWLGLVQLLKGPRGSGLESIKLDEFYGGHGLWAGLGANEKSRNLHCMEVELNDDNDRNREFAALRRHLPNMLYLRELQFHWGRHDTDFWKFMWTIQKMVVFIQGTPPHLGSKLLGWSTK
jgi:hypothetical protein